MSRERIDGTIPTERALSAKFWRYEQAGDTKKQQKSFLTSGGAGGERQGMSLEKKTGPSSGRKILLLKISMDLSFEWKIWNEEIKLSGCCYRDIGQPLGPNMLGCVY